MDDHYIAGFVDGEGSFHVAFQRNADVRIGWQAVPEFHVSQNVSSRHVLEAIRSDWTVESSRRIMWEAGATERTFSWSEIDEILQ